MRGGREGRVSPSSVTRLFVVQVLRQEQSAPWSSEVMTLDAEFPLFRESFVWGVEGWRGPVEAREGRGVVCLLYSS